MLDEFAGPISLEIRRGAVGCERALVGKGGKAAPFAARDGFHHIRLCRTACVIPRTELPNVMRRGRMRQRSRRDAGLRVSDVFHAGDGNLHPLVCMTPELRGRKKRRKGAFEQDFWMELCIAAGGSNNRGDRVGEDKKKKMMFEIDKRAEFADHAASAWLRVVIRCRLSNKSKCSAAAGAAEKNGASRWRIL